MASASFVGTCDSWGGEGWTLKTPTDHLWLLDLRSDSGRGQEDAPGEGGLVTFTLALSLPEVHSKRGALKADPRKGRGRRFQMPPAPPLPLHAGFLSREHFHFLLLRLPSEQVGPLGTQHLAFVPQLPPSNPFQHHPCLGLLPRVLEARSIRPSFLAYP